MLGLFVAEMLHQAPGSKAATKGLWLVRDPYDAHERAADQIRQTIEAENRTDALKAQRDSDAGWTEQWLAYGRYRLQQIERLARGGSAR